MGEKAGRNMSEDHTTLLRIQQGLARLPRHSFCGRHNYRRVGTLQRPEGCRRGRTGGRHMGAGQEGTGLGG